MEKRYRDTSKINDTALSRICRLSAESVNQHTDSSFLNKVFYSIIKNPRLLVTFCKLQDPQHEVLRETMGIPVVNFIGEFINGKLPVVTPVATEKDFLLDLLRYHAPYNPEGGVMSSFKMVISLKNPNHPVWNKVSMKLHSFYVSIRKGIQRPEGMEEETLDMLLKFIKVFHKIYQGNFVMLLEAKLPKSWDKKAQKTSRRVLQPVFGSEPQIS